MTALQPIAVPHLPRGRVVLAVAGPGSDQTTQKLMELGIEIVCPLPDPALPAPVRSHGDMLFFHKGERKILLAQSQKSLAARLAERGLRPRYIERKLSGTYPGDILLNGLAAGGRIFCHAAAASEIMAGRKIVFVRQGYAKCAACLVDENSIITADPAIAVAGKAAGMDVLRIREGYIALPGYPYGFIGGCCGFIDGETLLFTGDPLSHPDGERMLDFIERKRKKTLNLKGNLADIGGILPICENVIDDTCK